MSDSARSFPATGLGLQTAGRPTQRVDLHLLGAVGSSQVAVVLALQPRLPDHGVGIHAAEGLLLDLLGGDPADRAEQLRGQGPLRIAGNVDLSHPHAAELLLVLGEVVLDVLADAFDVHGGERLNGELLLYLAGNRRKVVHGDDRVAVGVGADLALDLVGRHLEHVREAAVDNPLAARRVRQIGRRDLHLERRVELTRTFPLLSRISPRGAAIDTSLTRLTVAALTYWLPVRTCRNQSLKKMIANSASATLPAIATRSASCGVIGGRRSSGVWAITNPG